VGSVSDSDSIVATLDGTTVLSEDVEALATAFKATLDW
jgi:hypothetical protein